MSDSEKSGGPRLLTGNVGVIPIARRLVAGDVEGAKAIARAQKPPGAQQVDLSDSTVKLSGRLRAIGTTLFVALALAVSAVGYSQLNRGENSVVAEQQAQRISTKVQGSTVQHEGSKIQVGLSDENNVFFEFNKYSLTAKARVQLNELSHLLTSRNCIFIRGHTDEIGTEPYNEALSLKRALSVYHYLIDQDTKVGRMYIEGHGETMPVADNFSEDGRAMNRRVELLMTVEDYEPNVDEWIQRTTEVIRDSAWTFWIFLVAAFVTIAQLLAWVLPRLEEVVVSRLAKGAA